MPANKIYSRNWTYLNGILFYCKEEKVYKAVYLNSDGTVYELYPYEYIFDSWNEALGLYTPSCFFSKRYQIDRILVNFDLNIKVNPKTKEITKLF